jgi:hypothetical protein
VYSSSGSISISDIDMLHVLCNIDMLAACAVPAQRMQYSSVCARKAHTEWQPCASQQQAAMRLFASADNITQQITSYTLAATGCSSTMSQLQRELQLRYYNNNTLLSPMPLPARHCLHQY